MTDAAFPRVPGYSITRAIGSGGFSTVYEATQDDIGSTVALKVLNVSIHDETGTRRLEREYRSMGRLRDQTGIVPVYATTATDDGRAVIVMAFMPGGSLHDRIRREGPLPAADVTRIADELATALDAAHALGIHHRDIKPENVLFDAHGHAALSDFGLATVEGINDASATAASLSPPHAPPERFDDSVGVDPARADIYSLASTLYTCASGRPPFGTSADGGIAALILRILTHKPPALGSTGLAQELADAIERGMAKSPASRPPLSAFTTPGFDGASQTAPSGSDAAAPILNYTATSKSFPVRSTTITRELNHPEITRELNHPDFTPDTGLPGTGETASGGLRAAALAIGLVIVATGVTALLAFPGNGGSQRRENLTTTSFLDTTTSISVADSSALPSLISVGMGPKGIAVADDGTLWVTNSASNSVTVIETRNGNVTVSYPVGAYPWSIAVDAKAAWVSNRDSGTVTRIDRLTDDVRSVAVGPEPDGITIDQNGSVWVAMPRENVLTEIDASSATVVRSIPGYGQPRGVAAQDRTLWVRDYSRRTVRGINLDTNEDVCPTSAPAGPYDIAVDGESIWISLPDVNAIARLDSDTCLTSIVNVGVRPFGIAVDSNGDVWFTGRDQNLAFRYDPTAGRVVDQVVVGLYPDAIAARDGVAWVSNNRSDNVSVIDRRAR